MAQSFSYILLSGTPANGKVIPVAATATPGTLIHTAIDGNSSIDEVEIFVSNVTANPARITIEWGGVGNPSDHIVDSVVIPAHSSLYPIVPGLAINGALIIRAYADVANALNVSGQCNRVI